MKKMTISKIDHNYGKIDNVSEILAGPFVCVKCLYLGHQDCFSNEDFLKTQWKMQNARVDLFIMYIMKLLCCCSLPVKILKPCMLPYFVLFEYILTLILLISEI